MNTFNSTSRIKKIVLKEKAKNINQRVNTYAIQYITANYQLINITVSILMLKCFLHLCLKWYISTEIRCFVI